MLFYERVLLDMAREQQRDRLAEAEAFRLARQFRGDDDVYPKLRQWLAGQVSNLLIAARTRLHAYEAEDLQVHER